MKQKDYQSLLKDPRWQRKRLEIMQRDNFTCQHCGNAKETLNVHHKYYKENYNPWDYEDDCYITLCEKCHSCVDAYRTVAWRIMELCLMGSRFWSASFVRTIFMGKMAGTNAVYYFTFVFAFYYFT